MGIKIDHRGYIRDRNWGGWYWDRECHYEHNYNHQCDYCRGGEWKYTSSSKTGISPWGGTMDVKDVYQKGYDWHYTKKKEKKERKDIRVRTMDWLDKMVDRINK